MKTTAVLAPTKTHPSTLLGHARETNTPGPQLAEVKHTPGPGKEAYHLVLSIFLCPGYLEAINITAIAGDKGHHPYTCEVGEMSSQGNIIEVVIVGSM